MSALVERKVVVVPGAAFSCTPQASGTGCSSNLALKNATCRVSVSFCGVNQPWFHTFCNR